MSQLALPLRLADHAIFGSFLSSGNEALVATLVDRPCSIGDAGEWTIGLEDSIVRVVEGPSGERDQLTAVEMLATDRSTVGAVHVIAGTEIRLV